MNMMPKATEKIKLENGMKLHRLPLKQGLDTFDKLEMCWLKISWASTIWVGWPYSTPGFKSSKQRISALFCANAEDSNYKLKPMVVSNTKQPHTLRNSTDHSPVLWRANKKAWFTQDIFQEWFDHVFVPEVREFLLEETGYLEEGCAHGVAAKQCDYPWLTCCTLIRRCN